MSKYELLAEELVKTIDIAIDAFQKYPPKNLIKSQVDHIINMNIRLKKNVLESQHKNIQNLNCFVEDIFTYFQESSGEAVEYFWKKIKENNLSFKRENKMRKILKRKKINNQIEYDFVIDVIVPYLQQGLITDDESKELNKIIDDFEQR